MGGRGRTAMRPYVPHDIVCSIAKTGLTTACKLEDGVLQPEWAEMASRQLAPDLRVAEVLSRWPQTMPVFFRHRMLCVGCAMAPFETLADVAAIYGLDLDQFFSELEHTIALEGEL